MNDESNTETKDFGSILAEFEGQEGAETGAEAPKAGDKVSGRILSIGEEAAFVELGGKAEGTIGVDQLKDEQGALTVAVGDTIEATVTAADPETGALVLQRRAAGKGQEAKTEIERAQTHGIPVEGLVTAVVKGGVEVQVSGLRAFCPVSQLALRYVEDPNQYVGQRLTFRVIRYEEGSRGRRPNIVLSRRALLEEEAQAKAAETRERLKPGAVLTGTVTSLTEYGAFVDLGGLEGMLHVSELGHARVAHPKDVLEVGQTIEVQVLKVEPGKGGKQSERISLSRKALESDPWKDVAGRYSEGMRLKGRVMRLESFGAFVEIAPGLEGLVHISELGGGKKIRHPREALQLGQDVEVTVLGVDPDKRRISLTTQEEGSRAAAETAAPQERERERERRQPTQPPASPGQAGGFGSMADFFRLSRKKEK